MHIRAPAIVCAVKAHGETAGIVRLLTADQKSGKTLEQAIMFRGNLGATSKLWVLYEFEAFHGGSAFAPGSEETEFNAADKPPPEGARNFLYLDGHVENL